MPLWGVKFRFNKSIKIKSHLVIFDWPVATECPITEKTDNITIQAMIIDKALVVMNAEEFEAIAPYFLGTSKIFGGDAHE